MGVALTLPESQILILHLSPQTLESVYPSLKNSCLWGGSKRKRLYNIKVNKAICSKSCYEEKHQQHHSFLKEGVGEEGDTDDHERSRLECYVFEKDST